MKENQVSWIEPHLDISGVLSKSCHLGHKILVLFWPVDLCPIKKKLISVNKHFGQLISVNKHFGHCVWMMFGYIAVLYFSVIWVVKYG